MQVNHEGLHAEAMPLAKKILDAGADSVGVFVTWTAKGKGKDGLGETVRFQCTGGNLYALECHMDLVLDNVRQGRRQESYQKANEPWLEKVMDKIIEKVDKKERGD